MKKIFTIGPDLLGDGPVLFEWSPKGNLLAAAGSRRKLVIYDRNGRLFEEVQLPPADPNLGDPRGPGCIDLQWDPVGDQLAVVPNGSTCILIWNALSRDVTKIETEFKSQEFSVVAWSKTGTYLAGGTAKGNLLIYNTRERKKMPYVGKHTKKIVCAVWNKDNLLALAGLDKAVSITDGATGETVRSFGLKAEPADMCVAFKKDDGYARREENTYSVNVARKTIYIMQLTEEGDRPVELAFQESYGAITKHQWFGDGYILVGFRSGQVVVVSSHSREITEEVYSGALLPVLTDLSHCASLNRIAVGGSSSVKILDTNGTTYNEVLGDAIELEPNQNVEKVGWTKDGQALSVSTTSGHVFTYLAALPVVFDYFGTKVIYLTSLMEMSIMDMNRRSQPQKIEIESEPAFCGLGPEHAAAGMNNQITFYRYSQSSPSKIVNRRDYLGSVQAIKLSESHAAVLTDGKVVVHPIEPIKGLAPDEADMVLPPPGTSMNITCAAITANFVIVGSRQGILSYFLVEDVSPVNEYRHEEGGIVKLYPQPNGARLIFEDDRGNINVFNPVNDMVLQAPGFSGRAENVMWDVQDPNVFVVADSNTLYVYLYVPVGIKGPIIQQIGKQPLPATHTPLMNCNGNVGCRLKNGSLDSIILDSHRLVQASDPIARSAPQKRFAQALALCRLKEAWDCALQLRQADCWKSLGTVALEVLDIDMAISAHRMVGDASMVLSLERIRVFEDKNLLAAHVLVLLEKDYDEAQELFLRSSQPTAALEMRKDLKHWSDALKLAEQLDPDSIGIISKEHAASLEMTGDYTAAKQHYQQALESMAVQSTPPPEEVVLACKAGICRTTLQSGDIRQGRGMAMQLNNPQLYKDCAHILEGLQQLSEAAEMYEKAGQYERAASIYIQTKNFNAAAPLMAKISSSKLQLQFAKAKEAEGRYAEAAAAYEAAGDMDSVVRLCLEKLGTPQRAYAIVRKTHSVEAAAQLSKHCLQLQDFQGAVEFLLMANQMDQAFDIAQGHNEMDTFARIVSLSAKPADFTRIAQYYESRGEYDKAADMWVKCEQHPRAVQLYLKVGNHATLEKAIAVVQETRNSTLGVLVLDFVNEEREGSQRDELRFRLNIAMGQYADAARDAMELARFEQEEGNYRVAHDKLFSTYKQLEALHKAVPTELVRQLVNLHSYTLVKSLIAINDHQTAARMLVRVARNISKFPRHVVPILTTTVIECSRAGLKKTAFEYASMLMRPEYRNEVSMKYKKKIELMVRKPEKDPEEAEEPMVDCVFCNMPGPETELQCISCQNIIPFDIATGKRMTIVDWARCPKCEFPCSSQQFIRILQAEQRCPMCNEEPNISLVKKVVDPVGQLRKASQGGGANEPLPTPSVSLPLDD